jgi:hypothetical protein
LSAAGEHADVQVVDQDQDVCAGVAAAESDVVQPAVVPQGQLAVDVYLVGADRKWPSTSGSPEALALGRAL